MKFKNIIKWSATIVQVCLIMVAITIYYLSNKKMGVMRSLTYRNDVYNKSSLKVWIIYSLAFMLLLFIITAIRIYKESIEFKHSLFFITVNLFIILFAIKINTDIVLAYYVLILSSLVLLIIQVIKFNFL